MRGTNTENRWGGDGRTMGLVDGPAEVHEFTNAGQVLKDHPPHRDGWPSQFRPHRLVAAPHRFEELIDRYKAVSGVGVKDLDWFRALVRYKQTAAGAFISRNARRRGAPVEPVDNTTSALVVSPCRLIAL